MTNELKKVVREVVLCLLFLSFQWMAVHCSEDGDENVIYQKNVPRAKLGESCREKICRENQQCNDEFICECQPGFKTYNNDCTKSAGENEPCNTHFDCCVKLFCINGICRRPTPNSEFITLAKICLGITVTTIIVAVFSFLLKCLLTYDSNIRGFPRQSITSSRNSILPFRRQHPVVNEVHDEKPPSYEECIRSTGRNPLVEPPPYMISATENVTLTAAAPTFQSENLFVVNAQNLTPLNVQNLSHDVNSNQTVTQGSKNIPPDSSVKSTS